MSTLDPYEDIGSIIEIVSDPINNKNKAGQENNNVNKLLEEGWRIIAIKALDIRLCYVMSSPKK